MAKVFKCSKCTPTRNGDL